MSSFAMFPLARVRVAENVRRDPGDVTDLAESIRTHGVLQPITVCPSDDGEWVEILMGQRRFAAAKVAGLMEVPCIMRARPSDRDRLLMQLAENFEREDMSPIDEALAFRDLIGHGVTQVAIGKALHRTNGWVIKRLRLLDLPDCLRVAVDLGWIHANAALEVPPYLYSDTKAMGRCARVVKQGNKGLRDWLRDEGVIERSTASASHGAHRTINVSLSAHEIAKDAAKNAGQSVLVWIEAAIRTHAGVA